MLLYLLLILPPLLFIFRRPLLTFLTPRPIPGIPSYSDGSPFLGDLPRVAAYMKAHRSFSGLFDGCAKELGVICQLRLGFFRHMVILTDYQTVEDIVTKRTVVFDRAEDTMAPFRPLIPTAQISLPTNDMWKHHRRIIGPSMTSKYLSLTTPRANESVKELIELWKKKAELAAGKTWAAERDMTDATMDAICGMAFGSSWGVLRSSIDQIDSKMMLSGELNEAVFTTTRPELAESTWVLFNSIPMFTTFPRLQHFWTSLGPAYRKHNTRMSKFLADGLAEARVKAKELGADAAVEMADNTLDLIVARELRGEIQMPDKEMEDEVFQYVIGGTETSGVTIAWWVKYMTNHPDVQRKLREHLASRLPDLQDRPPTFEEVNAINTPYLEAVVQETLRLCRAAGGFAREVMEDTIVLGKRLPKGTFLVMPTLLGHEDRSTPVYSTQDPLSPASTPSSSMSSVDSDDIAVSLNESLSSLRTDDSPRKTGYWAPGSGRVFNPDRWLDAEGRFDPNAGPSMPFSAGQRGCFGKNLALLEMRLFMSQLNQIFFFAPIPEEQNDSGSYETIARHPNQCFVRPVPWDSPEAMAA